MLPNQEDLYNAITIARKYSEQFPITSKEFKEYTNFRYNIGLKIARIEEIQEIVYSYLLNTNLETPCQLWNQFLHNNFVNFNILPKPMQQLMLEMLSITIASPNLPPKPPQPSPIIIEQPLCLC
jgi:hypothetical protein